MLVKGNIKKKQNCPLVLVLKFLVKLLNAMDVRIVVLVIGCIVSFQQVVVIQKSVLLMNLVVSLFLMY